MVMMSEIKVEEERRQEERRKEGTAVLEAQAGQSFVSRPQSRKGDKTLS